jgi:hypothetical protein
MDVESTISVGEEPFVDYGHSYVHESEGEKIFPFREDDKMIDGIMYDFLNMDDDDSFHDEDEEETWIDILEALGNASYVLSQNKRSQ